MLYEWHRSLNPQAVLHWGSPRTCEISQVGQKCLSGQQGLNLRRWSGKQVLWVFVAVSWAGQRSVHLPVGSAHQLCGLMEDLLPAHTDESSLHLLFRKQK